MPTLTDLSAMTYNIHMFKRNEGVENQMGDLLRDSRWRPTFLVMQEGWETDSTKAIASRANFGTAQTHGQKPEGKIGFFTSKKARVFGSGIASMSDWERLDYGEEFWERANPYQFETPASQWTGFVTKGFSWMRLQHPTQSNARVILYNLHGTAEKVGWIDSKELMASTFGSRKLADVIGKIASFRKLRLVGEENAYMNLQKLASHVADMARRYPADAVLVGGDFNWRHRWRPTDQRVGQGDIDVNDYNNYFDSGTIRYDVFGAFMERAGLTDYEKALTGAYAWSTPVDRWFFRNGTGITITPTRTEYWDDGTPWRDFSDHNPHVLYFNLTFQ